VIVAVLASAAVLGLLTGHFVLPAHHPAHPARRAGPSSPAAGPPVPRPATGPMTGRHLLTAAEVRQAGVTAHLYVHDRVGDGRYANAACAGEKTLGETLGGQNAHLRGLVTTTHTDTGDPTLAVDIGDQVARVGGSASLAQNFTERLLLEEVPCQQEPATHWVYGPTHTVGVAPAITASWMGFYDGRLNTTGAAPRDKEPCGGFAVLRNGPHFGVLEVNACLDTAAMTRIVRAAVTRL